VEPTTVLIVAAAATVLAGGFLYNKLSDWIQIGPPIPRALYDQRNDLNLMAQSLGMKHLGDHEYRGYRDNLQISMKALSAEPPLVVLQIEGTPRQVSLFPVLVAEAREASLGTGDAAFEQRFMLQGDSRRALAAMSVEVRAQLLALPSYVAIHMVDGTMAVELSGVADADALVTLTEAVLAICSGMGTGEDIDQRVLRAARPGGAEEIREEALTALLESSETAAGARREAAWMARAFGDPELRLLAVLNLGMDGLEEMLVILFNTTLHPSARARALRALPSEMPEDRYLAAVTSALLSPDLELKTTAAARLMRRPVALEPEVEAALTAVLGLVDDSQKSIVIGALREMGTVRSVELLLVEVDGRSIDADIRDQARVAIKVIQARALHAEAGAFSLSDGQFGELSLSAPGEDRTGGLSLSESGGE